MSATAASKILHVLHPPLFMMWDNTIIKVYGTRVYIKDKESGQSYLRFMQHMQKVAKRIIREEKKKGRSDKEAKESVLTQAKEDHFSKLLDEFNWVVWRRLPTNYKNPNTCKIDRAWVKERMKELKDMDIWGSDLIPDLSPVYYNFE